MRIHITFIAVIVLFCLGHFGLPEIAFSQPGLVAWYKLDGDFNDHSSNSYHATNIGTNWTNNRLGEQNKALAFDGRNSGLRLDNRFPNIFQGNLTVSMWVYFNDDSRAILLGSYSTANNVNFEKHTGTRLRIWWNNGQRDFYTPNNVVSLRKWHLVTFVRDKQQNKFIIYVDAKEVASTTNVGNDITPAGPFYIGRDSRSGETVTNGMIDDLRVYNIALNASQIEEVLRGQVTVDPTRPAPAATTPQPIDIAGSWSTGGDRKHAGRINIWQNGQTFTVIVSWPSTDTEAHIRANFWKSYKGEGTFQGRQMVFKVFPSSSDGRSADQGYVYHWTVSDDNSRITGYYTRHGKRTSDQQFTYFKVK